MSQQLTSAPVAAKRPRRLWRFIFPAFLLLVIVGVFLAAPVCSWADFDPEVIMKVGMFGFTMALPLCLLLMLVWFLAFSGFRWYVRVFGFLALLLFVGIAAGVAVACIRNVEFLGEVTPVFIFRWEPDTDAEFHDYLSQPSANDDLESINLSIDPVSDFPRYRGLNADGVVLRRGLDTDWNAKAPKTLWKHPCGGGYAGFAVAGNVAVTIEQRDADEAVVCYDRATGKERWVYAHAGLFEQTEMMGGDGPRATPTIADGKVYSLGANGHFVCLDGATGKANWSRDILKDNRAKNLRWGMSGSPLVAGNLVIVNPGIDPANPVDKALAAYDRSTGNPVWQAGDQAAGYSSPQLAMVAGVDQILLFDAGGLAGFEPKSGKELWRHPWNTYMDMNIIQPVVIGGDRIFIASEPTGCAMVRVRRTGDGFEVEQLWKNRKLGMKFSNPVAVNGFIYGISYEKLVCIDVETGKPRWQGAHYGAGQLLLVGDVLMVTEEKKGDLALVAAKPDKFDELARIEVLKGKTWNTPALAGKELFMRNHKQMTCLELPLAEK